MASVRELKKIIDYMVEEVLADSYLTIYFHSEKRDEIVKIMQETVDMRNNFYERANNPVEKHNKSLVKKHYAQLRRDVMTGIDGMFEKLSDISK